MRRLLMEISVVDAPPESVEADLLAFPVTDPAGLGTVGAGLDARLAGRLAHLAEDREIKGQLGHLALVHTLGEIGAHRLAPAGIGREADASSDALRTAASRVVARAAGLRGGTIAWALEPGLGLTAAEQARAIVDGTVLGAYDPGRWKTKDSERAAVERLVLCGDGATAVADTAARAGVAARWTNSCRELVDAPANELTPAALAERASEIASSTGLAIETWGPSEIEEAGMGAFAAVARGAESEPRLIVLRHEPDGAQDGVVLGIVGKAITFDTGGISIKPSARMDEMKGDMAGGGAVVAAMGAIAELDVPLRVLAVVPACENMPDGRAYRPGDILTALNGKTIEVTNTDAEGRLVLADALTHARRQGATHLVDLATLTGAVVVALGDFYAGVMGNEQSWIDRILEAAGATGDHAWQLPLHDTYKRLYRSPYADMKNSSDLRQAGSIYAARFLQEFAGDGPWAHLDIAGTAHLDRSRGDYYTQKGATGYGVRLLSELASRLAESAQPA
jgi:leucyl aminopeptidase